MANYVDPPNGVRSGGKRYFSMWQTLFEIDTKYVPIKPIGKGAYGIGCSSINRETNETVAIKIINNVFDNRIDALRTLRELKLLRHLRHENVRALKDVMVPVQRRSFKDVYLVYELMDTDLHQIIKSSQALSNDHCQYFLFQAWGLKSLTWRSLSCSPMRKLFFRLIISLIQIFLDMRHMVLYIMHFFGTRQYIPFVDCEGSNCT